MSKAPVVAEIGRPETAEETAARKAEFSKNYRASQTTRNLIAALVATLAVVAIVVFGVPRGQVAAPPPIDLTMLAGEASAAMSRPVLVPEIADDWQVNRAELEGGPTAVWDVTIAPSGDDERGFLRIAQAFGTDITWASFRLDNTAPVGTVTIDGREWDEFRLRNPEQSANISYALGTQAGSDYVLVYGALPNADTPEATAAFVATLTAQIDALTEAG